MRNGDQGMAFSSELQSMSNEALGRRIVTLIGFAGAGVCGLAALGALHGGIRYLMVLGTIAFLLTALLPTLFAPLFGRFLVMAATAIVFMDVGGGVKANVSLLNWLTILPVLVFALLLAFPGGAVWLFRSVIQSGR